MKVLAHPDPFALEAALCDGIRAAQCTDPLAPVLVLVPTARLAAHVRRRLTQTTGVRLAVEVLPHRALTRQAARGLPGPPRHLASPLLLRRLLDRALARLPKNPWSRFVVRRPGACAALLKALVDLREAGLSVADVDTALDGDDPQEKAVRELFTAYSAELTACAGSGLRDEADLVRETRDEVARLAGRCAAVFHHGAYDLIGIHLDLVRTIDAVTPVTFLLPWAASGPAFARAGEFARAHLLAPGHDPTELAPQAGVPGASPRPTGLLGDRLAALGNEQAHLPCRSAGIRQRTAPGPAAEADAALRHALHDLSCGVPAEEIALVARDLRGYAAAFETWLDDTAVSATASFTTPLSRDPAIADLIELVRVAAAGWPRHDTVAWLASPRLRWAGLLPDEPDPPASSADRWSRAAGVIGGLDEWVAGPTGPPHGSGEPPALPDGAEHLSRAIEALDRRLAPQAACSWNAHAGRLGSLFDDLFTPPDGAARCPSREHLDTLLSQMREMETLAGDRAGIAFSEMAAWLADAAARTSWAPHGDDQGGLRILDARQARGLTFRRLHLLGLEAGAFPRPPREDPVLGDALRRRIRDATGRPLQTTREDESDEVQMLASLLGSTAERLDLSWQRSDAGGRDLAPSPFLREIARITLGRASLGEAGQGAARLPGEPRRFLENALSRPGILSPREGQLLTALRCASPRQALAALAGMAPHLEPGLLMLAAVESFTPDSLAHDGRVPGASMPSVHSPSSLEELGTCPLRYFFRDVLHVERPEPEPGPDHLAPRLLGTAVHQLLHDLYAQLAREQAFEQEPAALQARAAALLQTRWESWVAALIGRHILRLPFLWREEARRWKRAISTFIAADLATIADEGWQPVDFELHVQRALELGHGTVLPVRGIFDRLLQQRGRRCVGDYKTGRADLKSRVGVTNMLRGIALQVPLYRMLAAAPGTDHPSDEELQVELLRIGLTDREAGEAPARRVLFAGFDATAQDDGFRETLRVLASLLRAGCFPLHHDGRICDHCDYALACRTNHVPTREREAHAVDGADFRDIKAKTATKETLLAGVRAAAARPPAGDEETP